MDMMKCGSETLSMILGKRPTVSNEFGNPDCERAKLYPLSFGVGQCSKYSPALFVGDCREYRI